MDAEMQRLLRKTLNSHGTRDRPATSAWEATPAPASSGKKRAMPIAEAFSSHSNRDTTGGAPSRAERKQFMSQSAAHIHEAPVAVPGGLVGGRQRGEDEDEEQEIDFSALSRAAEMLGAQQLEGLSKKDQTARTRKGLGLKPERGQKRPYPLLVALRKKQRTQVSICPLPQVVCEHSLWCCLRVYCGVRSLYHALHVYRPLTDIASWHLQHRTTLPISERLRLA